MTTAADRGGPFGSRRFEARNWMRASPPGIASPSDRPESSPVGGGVARPRRIAPRVWAAAALAVLGLALTGHALYIHAKAMLAQALLHRAWIATQATGVPAKPWPWADTTPVARLIAPEHDVDLLVLAGATGRTLAFGPGHHDGSALPGEPGNAVVLGASRHALPVPSRRSPSAMRSSSRCRPDDASTTAFAPRK